MTAGERRAQARAVPPAGSGPAVLVVVEQLRRPVPGGIGTYGRGLLQGLRAVAAADGPVGGGPDVTLYASRPPVRPDPLADLGFPLRSVPLPGPVLTRAWDRSLVAGPRGVDVVHAISLATPPARGRPLVVMVHDLAWRHVPEAFPPRGRRWHEAALRRARRRASHFMVSSVAVGQELVADGVRPEAVTLIAHGSDHLPPPDEEAARDLLERLGVTGEFLLSVGTLEPRKNLPRLFAAYARARPSLPGPWPLVVVGPAGWSQEGDPPGQGVVPAGPVGEATLAALYRRARLLAYVPVEEGFGLPPLEAMRHGTPVVASAVPSVDEAALVVEPRSVPAMAEALVRVATDDTVRADLVARGRAHAAPLTWEAAARAHVAVWSSLR
ncbi:MAG TPA: glycosyltransferase family 1 protein [Acidimicrobiales bacterium]|nr:glycosyltransferase family 1 protein [Acidimicrobiales bacterium]